MVLVIKYVLLHLVVIYPYHYRPAWLTWRSGQVTFGQEPGHELMAPPHQIKAFLAEVHGSKDSRSSYFHPNNSNETNTDLIFIGYVIAIKIGVELSYRKVIMSIGLFNFSTSINILHHEDLETQVQISVQVIFFFQFKIPQYWCPYFSLRPSRLSKGQHAWLLIMTSRDSTPGTSTILDVD